MLSNPGPVRDSKKKLYSFCQNRETSPWQYHTQPRLNQIAEAVMHLEKEHMPVGVDTRHDNPLRKLVKMGHNEETPPLLFFFFFSWGELVIQTNVLRDHTGRDVYSTIHRWNQHSIGLRRTKKGMLTRTGSHLSAFAPEPAGSLFLPLLSHFL